MHWAHRLLALDIAYVPEQEKKVAQREYLQNMVATSQSVEITAGGRSDGRAFEVSR